ncbi:MAG: hypothetical protein RLY70_2280, partial [Planctomycetota bacterium]
RGDDRRVLHLHGHWDEPDSVVLGIRSYEDVKNNEHTQAVMRALAMRHSLMLVGCGDEGTNDPNFGPFLTWLKAIETSAGVEHRHYRLVRARDRFEPLGRLFPLVYGDEYADLPGFLARLRPEHLPLDSGGAASLRPPAASAPLPDCVIHYLRQLADDNEHLTLLGMGRSFQVELPIADAYVPLRTTLTRSFEQRSSGDRHHEGHAEVERNVDLSEVFRETARLKQRGVILLGEPGSGKTTGARQLAWRLASGHSRSEDLGLPSGVIPVLLRFRNLTRAALNEPSSMKGLRRFLNEETHCAGAPDSEQSPGDALWNDQAHGLLWILDGLDEVVDPGVRQSVSGWIRDAIRQRPKDWFLVTCRFQGYSTKGVALGPKFVEFHVRGLDDAQVDCFVRSWFGAAYGKLLGPGAQAEKKAKIDSDELLGILARPAFQLGHIRELCTNPLLLTILCIVFHEERKLPTGRAELYSHCVRVLLEYWRQDLYTSDLGTTLQPYDAEAAQAVLARVAWWLHQEEQRTTAPLADLAAEATQALDQVSPTSGLGRSGADFLERMRTESGILAMGGEGAGRCGFLHLSFQEFLAAEYAAREGLARELASRATDSWWREVALLSLRRSRPFCEAFFREMLAAGIAERDADLAERCLQEALFFAPGPFVDELRRAHSPPRVAAVLRLLRERADQVPELTELCIPLAKSQDAETRGFATEILVRRGHAPPPTAPQPLDVVIDEEIGVTLIVIPPGEFQRGSEQGRSWEKPVRAVRITQSFQLGKYPVTNAQYERYLKAMGKKARQPKYWDNRRFNQPEQPVVGVSWEEAAAYCAWAGGRLPTEAEWEYACRAGSTTKYSFGDDEKLLGEYAWYGSNSGDHTQPVGAKKPNAWGLHDMHGNVWEWCQDWFDTGYYASSPAADPRGPEVGVRRVIRGGSWLHSAGYCRSSYRNRFEPANRDDALGFRVARSPSGQSSPIRSSP